MHQRLMMSISILDPLSNPMNQLPTRPLDQPPLANHGPSVDRPCVTFSMNSIICFMDLIPLHQTTH
ncbi:hypothetical protein BDF20DRAFT_825256 [Mycotypha africana]|uniref:uncharacterized protein n=1 Tax=Mycotypha africana TaxID=64632 RepID=UPI00230024D8|nr:uncharacterized protein BDF20DRAFT_825256 [Mycotypha africana]KAI8971991.1 hypothetical protein BDF20DRAFT_825256 [Mycotypha africana]